MGICYKVCNVDAGVLSSDSQTLGWISSTPPPQKMEEVLELSYYHFKDLDVSRMVETDIYEK